MSLKETKFLKIAVIVLILLNIGLMSNQWLMVKNQGAKEIRPHNPLTKEMNLSEEQEKSFHNLRMEHEERIEELKIEIAETRREFFRLLKEENSKNSKEYQATKKKLGELQEQEMDFLFQHFKEVREICSSEEQKEKFDLIIGRSIPRPNVGPLRGQHRPPHENRPPPRPH
tara:strand:+ start:132 stop:644 length:513 start_codon:yes stop_codon:yes gene_type:complete